MRESKHQQVYRKDAATLGQIGAVLLRAELPEIEVRLPDTLARAAVEAWEYDDEGPSDAETVEQRLLRGRAATLALIGLAVSERGRAEGNEVVIALGPDLIGLAVDAADDLPDSVPQ